MRIKLSVLFFVAFIVVVVTSGAVAEVITVGASELLPKDDMTVYSTNGISMQAPPMSLQHFLAPVVFPQGAVIREVTLEAFDNSGGEFGGYVRAELSEFKYNTFLNLIATADLDTGIEEAPGDTRIPVSLSHSVDSSEYSYGFGISINNPTGNWGNLRFYKLIVVYDITQLEVVDPATGYKLLKVD